MVRMPIKQDDVKEWLGLGVGLPQLGKLRNCVSGGIYSKKSTRLTQGLGSPE